MRGRGATVQWISAHFAPGLREVAQELCFRHSIVDRYVVSVCWLAC